MPTARTLSASQRDTLLETLEDRFRANISRHPGLQWTAVRARLKANVAKLWSLNEMEQSGGEPDVIGTDDTTGECIFVDCSAQSPKGRRSLCYDRKALEARKEHKPKNSAVEMAAAMGADLIGVDEYRGLQVARRSSTEDVKLGADARHIRKSGGALFCDRRFDMVFVYHNGAESYYAAWGFRCR